jgi:two-component sensor histidine kinase
MRRYIYFTMLGFLVFIITTFLLFFYLLVKRPLTEMARVAEDITGGRMRRVQTSRNDEIGRVIAIFNKMIDSLEENQKAQQASLEEKEVLLREIHHRVKNNLNIVSSLLNLQYDIVTSTNQAKQALKMSRDRIFSMALVHENLYQSETLSQIDMKAYIEAISNNLHNLYAPDKGIAIKNDIDNITMTIEYASPFGLLLNELITNSLTHAFPSIEDGTIEVSLKSRENGSYLLTVSDDGVGLPEGLDLRGTKSLGMQLVSILSEQLNGELTVRKDGGATFILDFHLE